MSALAISVMVRPSRLLLLAAGGICLAVLCAAGLTAFGGADTLPSMLRFSAAGICAVLAASGFFRVLGARKTFHIDISGVGQIRLRQDIDLAASAAHTKHAITDGQSGAEVVQLLADSTLWPHFMLLRLKFDNGRIAAIPVLPDSMDADSFRRLALACRWVAAQTSARNEVG